MRRSSSNALGDMVKKIRDRELTGISGLGEILKQINHNKHPLKKVIKILPYSEEFLDFYDEINDFLELAYLPSENFKLIQEVGREFTLAEIRAVSHIRARRRNDLGEARKIRKYFDRENTDLQRVKVGLAEKVEKLTRDYKDGKFPEVNVKPEDLDMDATIARKNEMERKFELAREIAIDKSIIDATGAKTEKIKPVTYDKIIDAYENLFGYIEGEIEPENTLMYYEY